MEKSIYLRTNNNNTILKFVYCFLVHYFIYTQYVFWKCIYSTRQKMTIFWSWIFKLSLFSFCFNIPCIHSRLFLRPFPLFPLFCLVESLGFRHFPPSTMSLELKLGSGRSCGACCRLLGGRSNWCPCWPTYTRTTDLPCLVFCSCGWLLRGKVGDQAPS